jgi:signal transduction histidine kinase
MVAKLEASRSELVDLAHRAGRAEVARTVLHDIGNVLNSIGVGAGTLRELAARSEVPSLRRVVDLLRKHEVALPEFLASDARGRQVLPFLDELALALEGEQKRALAELETLGGAVEHVSALLRSQNGAAQAAAELELLDPVAVVEQAAALVGESLARHAIEFTRRFEPVARTRLDRHRILQVLANLLTNAKHAVCDPPREGARIEIGLRQRADAQGEWIEFRVSDNGAGIESASIEKIFALGYSTRAGGQGIGLHSAVNLAREMGGDLRAESEGPGRGALFTLRIPLARSDA